MMPRNINNNLYSNKIKNSLCFTNCRVKIYVHYTEPTPIHLDIYVYFHHNSCCRRVLITTNSNNMKNNLCFTNCRYIYTIQIQGVTPIHAIREFIYCTKIYAGIPFELGFGGLKLVYWSVYIQSN